MKEIIEKLEKKGVKDERKSISRDLKLLKDYGYDIITYEENREGYFLASRDF
jgi:arginine repressor